ncbi:MAG: hypothetical protein ABL921_33745, partial [Pirellula sp.]
CHSWVALAECDRELRTTPKPIPRLSKPWPRLLAVHGDFRHKSPTVGGTCVPFVGRTCRVRP